MLLPPLLLVLFLAFAAAATVELEATAAEAADSSLASLVSVLASEAGTCAAGGYGDPDCPQAAAAGLGSGSGIESESEPEPAAEYNDAQRMDGGSTERDGGGVNAEEILTDGIEQEEDSEDWEDDDEMTLDLGSAQILDPNLHHLRSSFDAYLAGMERYVRDDVADSDDEDLAAVLPRCRNRKRKCVQWAMEGDCVTDAPYMHRKCAPACHACDMLIYERRCPYDPKLPPAWKSGDLNAMFERIVSDEALIAKYEPRVWSRPTLAEGDEAKVEGEVEYQVGGPWIVTLENVLTEDETNRILEMGDERGYERSDDDGEYREDGSFVTKFTEGRTSYNAWCTDCHRDTHGRSALGKIEEITRIPRKHFANLQLLRYEKTQKYEVHHDFDKYSVPRQPGPRIMTFFLYLSDVEEGGGTDFPRLNLTFTPKRGRALLWPNVKDDNPEKRDKRTKHQALPVVNGTKYAANAWIHLHDFQGPRSRNCDS